jgi:ketosteroid isomerase-like protein
MCRELTRASSTVTLMHRCVFEGATGPETCGTRHVGREQVRAAFAPVFVSDPDAGFRDARHFVAGDRGVSEWVFTAAGGRRIEIDGCDLFTFRGGKIARQSSFLKNRSS